MAEFVNNLRGEQGGAILSGTDSFDSSTFGAAQVVQIKILEDGTEFSDIKMPNVDGGESYYESYAFEKGDFIDGLVTAATLSSGACQVFLHKRDRS